MTVSMRSVQHRVPCYGTLGYPTNERAFRIGDLYSDPRTQSFADLLIDLEESPHARAVVLGELRERELRGES